MFAPIAPARSPRRMRVALDIEGCLDRFYGGYYSGKFHILSSICLMTAITTTTIMMLFNRLGLRWTIQSMFRVCSAAGKCLPIRSDGSHRLLRWNSEGEQETSAGAQWLPAKNDLGREIWISWKILKVIYFCFFFEGFEAYKDDRNTSTKNLVGSTEWFEDMLA